MHTTLTHTHYRDKQDTKTYTDTLSYKVAHTKPGVSWMPSRVHALRTPGFIGHLVPLVLS